MLKEKLKLKKIPYPLTICKVRSVKDLELSDEFYFIGKTDDEISLVCITENTPDSVSERDDGWSGFRIQGILDFSLTGILAGLSAVLAENGIGIFAVSTFNTDYILVKTENLERAMDLLAEAGYVT